jgi:hypothetical protein
MASHYFPTRFIAVSRNDLDLADYDWQCEGRSFSLMAGTRQLVTSGPYRFVRDPFYPAEEIAMFGLFMQFASPSSPLLLAVHITVQLRRMHNEELVLTASFPEYVSIPTKYRPSDTRDLPTFLTFLILDLSTGFP